MGSNDTRDDDKTRAGATPQSGADDDPGRMSSGSPREAEDGVGTSGYTGNTGGSGGSTGASTENGGNAGLAVGNGGGPDDQTLGGEPPPRQTSDLTGTGGSLDDRPSSGIGNTDVDGGQADDDARKVGAPPYDGLAGAREP